MTKSDIESAKQKIEKTKQEEKKQENWEIQWMIQHIRNTELDPAEYTLEKEQNELRKLLSHENPVIRQGAITEYEKYLLTTKTTKERRELVS